MSRWQIKAIERAHYIALLLAERHEAVEKHRVTIDAPFKCYDCAFHETYTEKAREEANERD